ncbi:hypothetical protein Hte_001288 [Hypoxylon texense]
MPFFFKNILYRWQKRKVEEHVIRGFGSANELIKEVKYVEDEDDGTPCILVIFLSERATKCQANLELIRLHITRDTENGLDQFRIDVMAEGHEESRQCLMRRACRYRLRHQKP